MTKVNPCFRVEVSFRAILLCLIFNRVLIVINIFMTPKLPLDGHIYTLTAGRFLKTKVFRIKSKRAFAQNHSKSGYLKWTTWTVPKSMHISKTSQLVYGKGSFTSGS